MMLLPCASSARALARVSNAVSVPRRAMRLASRSSVGVVTEVIFYSLCRSLDLLVDRLFLALRSQYVCHGIRHAALRFLEVPYLKVAQQSQGKHLAAKHDQDGGGNQQRPVFSHHAHVPDQLRYHEPESHAQPAQQ